MLFGSKDISDRLVEFLKEWLDVMHATTRRPVIVIMAFVADAALMEHVIVMGGLNTNARHATGFSRMRTT